jgi:beta-fructofuranosidase
VLRLEDDWVWDSWVADDGDLFHLYFLQAPRALGDPSRRHTSATVGHATSRDLVTWDYLGQCLGPAETGFDDLAVWTGSVVAAQGRWWMFYTAISTAGHHVFDQRVGAAVSDDLHHWERVGDQPALHVDRRWYKTLHLSPPGTTGPELDTVSETWRDPLVIPDPDGEGWHMLLCARGVGGGRNDDGVVGHAYSADLLSWETRPPRSQPGAGFGQLEVVQSKVIDGRAVMVFTCHPREMTDERVASGGPFCIWSVPSSGLLGPWDVSRARPFTADPDLFAAPLVQRRDGSWVILGFRNLEPYGEDGFAIGDPIPVRLDADGYLVASGDS